MALRAKLYLDGDIFFLILRSKIRKKMSPSKEYFAAAGGENLFTQPQILFGAKRREKTFHGASRHIIFGWRHLFLDFAKQNQEKDVSIPKIFRRCRRRNTFYTIPDFIFQDNDLLN
jgi:hypothetical protein